VESYYEETHRAFIAKHYTEYGNRIKNLWEGRPKRPYPQHKKFLIGRTTNRETVKEQQVNEVLEVSYIDITSTLLPLSEENSFLTKKTLKISVDLKTSKSKMSPAMDTLPS